MKPFVMVLAAVIAAAALLGLGAPLSTWTAAPRGPDVEVQANNTTSPAELSLTIIGNTVNGQPRFDIGAIYLPQVPIVLNLTFFNNETLGDGVDHTFTIDDANGNHAINSGLIGPQESALLTFTINSLTNITYNGTSFTPLNPGNGTVEYFCIPHQALGMVGYILMAGAPVTAAQPQKGIVIRAYWIGIIAFVAMLIWIGIAYFVIKSSSPRFRDSKDHVRRGLT